MKKKIIISLLNGISEVSIIYIGLIILNRFNVLIIPESFGSLVFFFAVATTCKNIADIMDKKHLNSHDD